MQPGEPGTIDDHERNAAQIATLLMTLVERSYYLCVTHGNGPQVGNLLVQHELVARRRAAAAARRAGGDDRGQPRLHPAAGAAQRAAQAADEALRRDGGDAGASSTRTDPAFQNPTKPIGPFLSREEAERRRDQLGWKVKEDAGRGWRRLVPSPQPLRVIQRHMIRDAVRQGHIVIACGGGGIPVKKQPDGQFAGARGGDRQGPDLERARRRPRRRAARDPDRRAAGRTSTSASHSSARSAP